MKHLFKFWIAATLLFVAGCSESYDNGDPNDNGGNTPTAPTITLNTSSISFDEYTDEEKITFSTTADWTAEIINNRADGWLSVTPQSGSAGDASITIKAKENDTPDERNASVRIKAGSASKTISVSQKQKDALTVTSSKFEVESKGGEIKIEVKANIDFEYAIDESAQEWIKYEGTRAIKTSTLTFSVAENDDTEKREGKIAIKSGEFNEVVTIYQAGSEPSIVISQNEYVVSSDGETISVEVSSNVDVAVEMPADADWISENTTRATSTNTYRFDIQPNEDYDQRSAEIKFTNKENNLSEVVKVTQVQKDALVVAKESYTVDSDGGQLHIEVGHNVDFDIEISNDWITKAENTRAFVTETLVFNIAKNPTTDNREGTIIFKSKDGKLSQTVKVYQTQEDALIISKKDIVVSDEGGTISFELQTNVEFTVSEPDVDWLRAVTTRALTTHTLNYTVDANTSYDSREAKIVVTDTKNNKSETITITQAQKDAIVLAKSEYEFGVDGGNLDFEIQTNVDVTVTISTNATDWIQQVETRALETKALYFNVASCSAEEDREGTITISGGDATQTIIVKQNGKKTLEKEREALIAFYNATGGDNWKRNDNWCSDKPVSEWYGVYTNPSYYGNDGVCILDLSDNNLTGGIPEEIGDLTFLHSLNLMGNTFTGGIPATIGNLTKLETLELSYSNLSGEIPSEIGKCSNLTIIQLNDNRLSGTIPNEIGKLTQLKWLHLYNNNLSGDLPTQIGDCVNLENLNLSNNNISGSIPAKIVNLTNLRDLNIAENKLTGAIPADIGNMRNLIYLQLCDNFLSGNIPESIYQIPTLTLLLLSRNKLTGVIPESLGDCLVLENLYLDENELTGGIPASLSKMPNLKVLHLGSNKFFGEIPSALGNCPVLENLFLYDNELTGKLPEEIINIHTLKQLRIQNNKLNGECSELLTTFIENLDVYYIEQQPGYELKLNFYQSTDFSQDGKVITLQQHTKGPGIRFVITMDGFSDRLIADGTVNSYIQMAYETLFSREPYTSFKEYFDVYAVLTVSKREKLMTDTALQTGGEVDRFCLHHDLVEAYAKKIPAINNDMSNTHILVILNDKSGVRANCSWTSYGSMSCASIIMEDNTSRFDGVIRHEVLGHGFGQLGDEYVEVGLNGDFSNYPEEDKQGIWDEHKRGWYLNVDVTNDPEKIVWKDFLSNPDYASENIGIYEGALLYERGAYRATDYSIMRYNTGDFNAPSRWAIYKHIMEIAGEEYSLETFFEYDKKNLVQTRSAGSKSAQSTPIDTRKLGAKPVFLNR